MFWMYFYKYVHNQHTGKYQRKHHFHMEHMIFEPFFAPYKQKQ